MFIGREPELDQLRREFDAPRASVMVVYERRRIVKSALSAKPPWADPMWLTRRHA